jgi:hypothetical protein
MRLWTFALLVPLALTGCGGEKVVRVSGTVTVGGKPVPGGTISFVPPAGKAAVGSINPDGTYTLGTYQTSDGALLGSHKVVIHATRVGSGSIVSGPTTFEDELKPVKDSGKAIVPGKVDWIVPERFSQLATTDLTASVETDGQRIDFDLPPK